MAEAQKLRFFSGTNTTVRKEKKIYMVAIEIALFQDY